MSGYPSRGAFGARGGKPKIRPPRKPTPETTVKEMWERLAAGIKEIQNHNASSLSYEVHYRYAYNMVLFKHGDQLYSGTRQLIADHLDHLAATLIVPSFPRTDPYASTSGGSALANGGLGSGMNGEGPSRTSARSGTTGGGATKGSSQAVERVIEGDVFLKSVKGVWEDHTTSMQKVQVILRYMDKTYTHSAEVPLITDVGLHLFLTHIIHSPKYPIHSHLISTLLSQVQLERDGETIPRSTVRECIDILLRLSTLPPTAPPPGSGAFGNALGHGHGHGHGHGMSRAAAAMSMINNKSTVYAVEFEPEFLRRSAEFYEDEAAVGVELGNAASYLRNVDRRLSEENDRTTHYLSPDTSTSIRELVIDKLLTPHLNTVMSMSNTGLRPMLDGDRIEELALMYDLYCKVPSDQGRMALRAGLKGDIAERGKVIDLGAADDPAAGSGVGKGKGKGKEEVAATATEEGEAGVDTDMKEAGDAGEKQGAGKKDKGKGKAAGGPAGSNSTSSSTSTTAGLALSQALRWVQDVLDLKDKFDRILDRAFAGDKGVQTSINEAFQSFINAHQRAPEFLSLFIDEHLKKGTKAATEDEIEVALEKTITLFRFLADKDKFERYYKTHLARRLLYGKSASDDAEKGMVAKLKVEMGYQFTQKLEGMFTDMRLSEESGNAFRNYVNRQNLSLPFDLSVSVLTTSHWPPSIITASPLTIPAPLSSAIEVFERYYDSRHSGRRLTWQGNLGTADIRVRFKSRSHDVNCTTQAAVVLLTFAEVAEGESLGYEDLKSSTSLPDADLIRTLQSLACGKYRILTKLPKGRDVSPTDRFAFNDTFTCPLARIKIMQVAARVESAKEKEETEGMVQEERKHQIEACIVRIMKNRKIMSHNDLVSEVAHQLSSRFSPSLGTIKKRIEGLIEREYLERDTEEIGRYRYLA